MNIESYIPFIPNYIPIKLSNQVVFPPEGKRKSVSKRDMNAFHSRNDEEVCLGLKNDKNDSAMGFPFWITGLSM